MKKNNDIKTLVKDYITMIDYLDDVAYNFDPNNYFDEESFVLEINTNLSLYKDNYYWCNREYSFQFNIDMVRENIEYIKNNIFIRRPGIDEDCDYLNTTIFEKTLRYYHEGMSIYTTESFMSRIYHTQYYKKLCVLFDKGKATAIVALLAKFEIVVTGYMRKLYSLIIEAEQITPSDIDFSYMESFIPDFDIVALYSFLMKERAIKDIDIKKFSDGITHAYENEFWNKKNANLNLLRCVNVNIQHHFDEREKGHRWIDVVAKNLGKTSTKITNTKREKFTNKLFETELRNILENKNTSK